MPLYEYYCRRCNTRFELLRSMARAAEPATCPSGHGGGQRTLSVFVAARAGVDATGSTPASGGGCACGGGGCGCGH